MTSRNDQNDQRDSRLEELALALKEAQLMLLKQSELLDAVTHGETDEARQLAEMRDQVAVITAERDPLQDQLLALEAQVDARRRRHPAGVAVCREPPGVDDDVVGIAEVK